MFNLETLRSGTWLDSRRLGLYPGLILTAFLGLMLAALLVAKDGRDWKGRPLGPDFLNVYAASILVLQGLPAAAYDPERHRAAERKALGDPPIAYYYGWHYPPLALLPAAPLALLPYGAALFLWLAATFALGLAALWPLLPKPVPLALALGFPAIFVNIAHGQNGFLTLALLGGGLVWLERRPALAGILFGLAAYKPQFGLLVPVALLAGGHYRTFLAAAVALAAFMGLSLLAFGTDPWLAFLAGLTQTAGPVMEAIGPAKLQSVWAAARLWGLPAGLAMTIQGLAAAAAAGLVWRLWRAAGPFAWKAAGLVAAGLLATPYVLDYDLVLLALPLLFLARQGREAGFLSWQKSALAALWLLPLFARPLAMIHVPAAVAVLALVVWGVFAWRRGEPASVKGHA